MSQIVEKTGKNVEEAIQSALDELQCTRDEAEIEVLAESTKGLWGILGSKDAKVRVWKREDSKAQAEAIATAVDMKLIKCLKTDFKPFEQELTSNSLISSSSFAMGDTGSFPVVSSLMAPQAMRSVAETIQRTFTPEDICVSETVFCLWLAE